jgi:hypothetical protein
LASCSPWQRSNTPGFLETLATWLDHTIGRQDIIVLLLGLLSAIVDNVPLVAASMGKYPLSRYPTDSFLWECMAYCAGTGRPILIIGSAAGVAVGIEKIQFIWYMRRARLFGRRRRLYRAIQADALNAAIVMPSDFAASAGGQTKVHDRPGFVADP